jgi:uncharacterized phage protein (predicted DNA packaging)
MVITLEQAKQYLRLENTDEDALIQSLILTAENLCEDILRFKISEFEEVPEIIKTSMLFSVAYLFENRETANYDELLKSLKILLSSIRLEMF